MKVTSAETVEQFVAGASGRHVLLAHPDPDAPSLANAMNGIASEDAVTIAIGPEGGFTDDEVEAAKAAGRQVVTLGPRILRIETAAIAVASSLVVGRGK